MKSKVLPELISDGTLLIDDEFETQPDPEADSSNGQDTLTWRAGSRRVDTYSVQPQPRLQSSGEGGLERYGPLPLVVFVSDLGDPRLTLKQPLPVVIQYGDTAITACSYDLEDFGVGDTEFEAVNDLKATIAELYFALKENQDRLGPQPEKDWLFLRSIINES